MEKIARFLVGVVAFAVIGGAGYYGLRSADAQTGGGYPSRPKFQTVFASAAATAPQCTLPAPGVGCFISTTSSAWGAVVGNTAGSSSLGLEVQSGTSAAAEHVFRLQNAAGSTTYLDQTADGVLKYLTPGAGLQTLPQMLAFNVGFNGAGAPALQSCLHCGASPSVARGGVGSYTVTHNAAIGAGSLITCTPANGTATYAYSVQNLTNTANITLLTFAGAAVDGTAAQSLSCIAIT